MMKILKVGLLKNLNDKVLENFVIRMENPDRAAGL